MKELVSQLTDGWHFMRYLRLIIAMILAAQAIQMHDWMIGCMAAFFLFQSLTNTGCCGNGSCHALPGSETGNEPKRK